MSTHARSLLGLGSGLRCPTAASRLSSIKLRIIAPVFGAVCLKPPLGVPFMTQFPGSNTENWTLCCRSKELQKSSILFMPSGTVPAQNRKHDLVWIPNFSSLIER
ncbi:hypothetical protein B0H13DRAFT_1872766 [Mycena leptocephala]|nr:hypothetical protein B0H13DRAFT_1872766 [Mycena leptocephala]